MPEPARWSPAPARDGSVPSGSPDDAAVATAAVATAADPAVTGLRGVVELLAAVAHHELATFTTVAAQAAEVPGLEVRAALAEYASTAPAHHRALVARLRDLGVDPLEAMRSFEGRGPVAPRVARASWLEDVVAAHVAGPVALDYWAVLASRADADIEQALAPVAPGSAATRAVIAGVRATVEADPRLVGRTSLWGRRMVGEAVAEVQRTTAEHDGLSELALTGRSGLSELGDAFGRITAGAAERMRELGLNP